VVSRFRACVAVLYDVCGAPWRGEGSTRGGGDFRFHRGNDIAEPTGGTATGARTTREPVAQ
jgi:hypothetical protein